ncbi:hypothetical protein EZV73_23880 [Acidaminobacter sp. JC074]|uniref:hypothetical protein n=1 Tax=Acidaminobacter sp. JC074 TaxID=2530199 RepID=UPI001F0D95DF|nr:hypothetical protein [Acidaminobacter sp. JC074]MCH4890643.1 hypothetical protein [Acidaminobacter sp. JC074]
MDIQKFSHYVAVFNIAIIVLTVLDNKKHILGKSYYGYLLESHRSIFRIKLSLLVSIIAILNIIMAWLPMTSASNPIYHIFIGITLVFSLLYAYSYIIRGFKNIKIRIYKQMFLGLYETSKAVPTRKSDLATCMPNGHKSDKDIPLDTIFYFNEYNEETKEAFDQIFGPKSFLYDKKSKLWIKINGYEPIDYRTQTGLNAISYECFDFIDKVDSKATWLLHLLTIFNKDYSKDHGDYKINNLIRIIDFIVSHEDAELYSSSMLEVISKYAISAIQVKPKASMREYRDFKESYMIKRLYEYIFKCIDKKTDLLVEDIGLSIYRKLYRNKTYIGYANLDVKKIISKLEEKTESAKTYLEIMTYEVK